MATYTVYSKAGKPVRGITVKSLDYTGSHMGERYITITVTSATPVDWAIGDYIMYRGEKFELNTIPSVVRNSRSKTNGESLKYESIKFSSVANELVRCMFLDIVLGDNEMHYTSLPNFSFYAEDVTDLAERIKANLDRLYGDDIWTVKVAVGEGEYITIGETNSDVTITDPTYGGETRMSISVDNQNCWNALALVNSEFDLEFRLFGRTIYIGKNEWICDTISADLSYGKGNGLINIERNVDSSQEVITRLRAYGNTTNMPNRYYATLGQWNISISNVSKIEKTDSDGKTTTTYYITTNVLYKYEQYFSDSVRFSISGHSFRANKFSLTNAGEKECITFEITSTANLKLLKSGTSIERFTSGVDVTGLINASSTVNPPYCTQYCPNNMSITRLMLPGFPMQSLKDYDAYETEHNLSEDALDPYVDSTSVDELGVREYTVYADGSNEDFDDIYPTIEEMTAGQLVGYTLKPSKLSDKNTDDGTTMLSTTRLDEVDGATQILDNGIYDGDYYQDPTTETITNDVYVVDYASTAETYFHSTFESGTYKISTSGLAKIVWSDNTVTGGTAKGKYEIRVVSPSGSTLKSVEKTFSINDAETLSVDISNQSFSTTESGEHRIELRLTKADTDDGKIKFTFEPDNSTKTLTKELKMFDTFVIYIKDLGFNPDGYSEEKTFTISMKSGMCCGRDFEVYKIVETDNGYEFHCKRENDDTLNMYFPYNGYNIQANDQFVLTGIYMPDVYVKAASEKLYQQAKDYIDANCSTAFTYTPKIDNIFMAREYDDAVANGRTPLHDSIHEGQKIHFFDTELGIDDTVTIDQLTIKEGSSLIPQYSVTLRDEKDVSTIQALQNKVSDITNGIIRIKSTSSGSGVKLIKSNDTTSESDSTAYSSLRAYDDFLSKVSNDSTPYILGMGGANITNDLNVGNNVTVGNTTKTKDLIVTGQAHFFELVIDKIKHSGGATIWSTADGFKADYVYKSVDESGTLQDNIVLYWQSQDEDGVSASNTWVKNDQILCQSFNRADSGYNVSNKYFWGLVTGTSGNTPTQTLYNGNKYIDELLDVYDGLAHKKYNYVILDTADFDGEWSNLDAGDEFVQLGNRTDTTRQSAVYVAANTSLDSELDAPCLAFYRGIKNYSLKDWRQTYFDRSHALFKGQFTVVNDGGSTETPLDDYITKHAGTVYTYYAYSKNNPPTSADDVTKDSTIGQGDDYKYIGICVTGEDTQPEPYPDESKKYAWTEKGIAGESAIGITLSATRQGVVFGDDGKAIDDTDVTLTAVKQNTTNDIVWFTLPNGDTTKKSTPTSTKNDDGSEYITLPTSIIERYNYIEVVAQIDGTNLCDSVSVQRIDNGSSSYSVILCNESHIFYATDDGKAIASSIEFDVICYKGGDRVAGAFGTITKNPYTGMTVTGTNGSTNSSGYVTNAKVNIDVTTDMVTTNGSVTIPVIVCGNTIEKTFSFSLSVPGTNGDSAKGLEIICDKLITTINENGKVVGEDSVTLTALLQNVTGNVTWSYNTDGGSSWTRLPGTDSSITITPSSYFPTYKEVKFKATLASDSSIYDVMTLGYTMYGNSAYTIILSNENVGVSANENGHATDTAIDSDILCYKNGVRVPFTIDRDTIIADLENHYDGISLNDTDITKDGTSTQDGHIAFILTDDLCEAGSITIPLIIDGTTYKKELSYTINAVGKTGGKGDDAIDISLSTNRQVVGLDLNGKTIDSSKVVITATKKNSNADIEWSVKNASGESVVVSEGINSISFLPSLLEKTEYIVVVATLIDTDYSDTMTIGRTKDGSDSYTVLLSNESQLISAGTTYAYATTFSTEIIAYKGSNQLYAKDVDVNNLPTGITATPTDGSESDGVITNASVSFKVAGTMSTKTGTIKISFNLNDGSSFTKDLSYSLSLKGATGTGTKGDDGITFILDPSNLTFTTNDSGAFDTDNPDTKSVSITAKSGSTTKTITLSAGSVQTNCSISISGTSVAITVKGSTEIQVLDKNGNYTTKYIAPTSGCANVNAKIGTNSYPISIPFTVDVKAFFSYFNAGVTAFKSQYDTFKTNTNSELEHQNSLIEQTASEITMSVSPVSRVGSNRLNLLENSGLWQSSGKSGRIDRGSGDVTNSSVLCDVNNEIGGANMAWNRFDYDTEGKTTYKGFKWGGVTSCKGIGLDLSSKYTLTFYVKSTGTTTQEDDVLSLYAEVRPQSAELANRDSSLGTIISNKCTIDTANQWIKQTVQFTTDATHKYYELFIYGTTSKSGVVDLYIAKPMLVKGDTEHVWSLSDYDDDYVGGNLLVNSDKLEKDITGYADSSKTVPLGLTSVYSGATRTENAINGSYSIGATATDSMIDYMIRWGLKIGTDVFTNTDYVLSFYAKGTQVLCLMYEGVDDNKFIVCETHNDRSIGGRTDGICTVNLDSVWKKYYVHFHTPVSLTGTRTYSSGTTKTITETSQPLFVSFRINAGYNATIACPKLEKGCIPTDWKISSDTVTLYGSSVESKLLNTGIDITNRRIDMTADNFTLYNNSGEQTLGVDNQGNLSVSGIINASSLKLKKDTATEGETINGAVFTDGILPDLTENDGVMQLVLFAPQVTRSTSKYVVSCSSNAEILDTPYTYDTGVTSVTLNSGIYMFYGFYKNYKTRWYYYTPFS